MIVERNWDALDSMENDHILKNLPKGKQASVG